MAGVFDEFENRTSSETVGATAVNDLNKVRVTLKGGSSYAAPWITVDGTSVPDALSQLEENGEELYRLVELTQKISGKFAGMEQKPAVPKPTAPTQEESNGERKSCVHGEMTFRSGFSQKTGKAYQGYFCPERDREQQCKPVFTS